MSLLETLDKTYLENLKDNYLTVNSIYLSHNFIIC